jgi:cytochrome c55X
MRLVLVLALLGPGGAAAQDGDAATSIPTYQRQQVLVRLVRQDCGSCHGMRLTGGLGPPLTRLALAERPLELLVATTLQGRPGTPMPGWETMLSASDARWIAQQLKAGFPSENPR